MFFILRRLKNQVRKAEAASALQNLLEMQVAAGNFDLDPHLTANVMITENWQGLKKHINFDVVDAPHKVAFVALALAKRLEQIGVHHPHFFAYGLSLGTVMNTIQRNEANLNFSVLDKGLIVEALKIQDQADGALSDLPIGRDIDDLIARADSSDEP